MTRFRYRDDESSVGSMIAGLTVGVLAGFAVGIVVAQRVGGLNGITTRLRGRVRELSERFAGESEDDELTDDEPFGVDSVDELDEAYDKGDDDMDPDEFLEGRVLRAFRHDPILSERAIDIGAIGEGIIELTGWVNTDDESEHAVAVTRAIEGIATVVNRLNVGEMEELLEDNARRFEEGDPALTEARWEGQRVGTGQRRQGTSADVDRHATPKPALEERWMREDSAVQNAADDTGNIAERRRSSKKSQRGGRTDGSAIAPTGVPKADHVANPEEAPDPDRAD